MSDNNKNSVLPDVIEPISNAIQQNIPETAKQTDGALSTIVGFFNNVVYFCTFIFYIFGVTFSV